MTVSKFSQSLVNILSIIDYKIKRENEKDKRLQYIDDCIDWVKALQDILLKKKKEIKNGN